MNKREYVVTLHNFEDLESFYHDMETPGGNLYIPNRAVEVSNRRPASRNTYYLLTDEEAELVKNDPRVLAVELSLRACGFSIKPAWTQSSSFWNKSNTLNNSHLNWGILRCVLGEQIPNWGTGVDGFSNTTGTVTVTSSGKHVDIVIVDGHIDPTHPEFAVNSDGTGGSRVVQYNWFGQHDSAVRGSGLTISSVYRNNNLARISTLAPHGLETGAVVTVNCTSNSSFNVTQTTVTSVLSSFEFSYVNSGTNVSTSSATGSWIGTYVYTPYTSTSDANLDLNNNHGAHVAGTACGNKYGWARDANIYNIVPYGLYPSSSEYFLDYIKEWHKSKPVNSVTGLKNPTITNHSYGIVVDVDITDIETVNYNGVVYTAPFTSNQLNSYGIFNDGISTSVPIRNSAVEADLLDLVDLGVIVVGAAGNETSRIANFSSTSTDYYNNYFEDAFFRYYYGRGSITAAGTGTNRVICVSSIGTSTNETKLASSNSGPRIDVFAPGTGIISSVNSNTGTVALDTRNSQYYITKKSGTSMASPQVAGILACLAEQWPTIKQHQALEYLITNSKPNQITDTNGGLGDDTDLNDAPNRYLYYKKERLDSGQLSPKLNQGLRPTSGMLYPRPKIYRYGR